MRKLHTEYIKGTEVTEEKYEEMLGILPPAAMCSNAFLVGEPVDHGGEGYAPRFDLYFTRDGKYFHGGLASVQDFRTFILPEKYEGPADVQMCDGDCGTQIAVPDPRNALSRYGHGQICTHCGLREALEGDFISRDTAAFMASRK